jgi:membrane protein YqaA with SNARE-associated domain
MPTDPALYSGLFIAAFVAATLLPAQSELALGALIMAGNQPVWALIGVAAAGNTLGSCLNWLLGRYFFHLRNH